MVTEAADNVVGIEVGVIFLIRGAAVMYGLVSICPPGRPDAADRSVAANTAEEGTADCWRLWAGPGGGGGGGSWGLNATACWRDWWGAVANRLAVTAAVVLVAATPAAGGRPEKIINTF